MSSPCGPDCETNWWFGEAGVCNNVTFLCECPPGYNGIDEWKVFNDCHVNANTRLQIRYAIISVCILQIVVAVVSLVRLFTAKGSSLTWALDKILGAFSEKRRQIRQAQAKARLEEARKEYELSGTFQTMNMFSEDLFSEGESELEREIKKQEQFFDEKKGTGKNSKGVVPIKNQDDNEAAEETVVNTSKTSASRRVIDNELVLLQQVNKRVTLMVVFMLAFAVTLFFYELSFIVLNEIPSTAEINNFQNFNGGWAIGSMVAGIWYLIYIWYKSLPSLSVYGKLFGLSSVFIRYNHLLGYVVAFFMTLTYILCLLFVFLLPIVDPDNLESWNDGTIWSLTVLVIVAIFFLVYIFNSLITVYSSSLEALSLRKKAVMNAQNNQGIEMNNQESGSEKPFKINMVGGNSEVILDNLAEKEREILGAKRVLFIALVFGGTSVMVFLVLAMGLLYIDSMSHNFYICLSALTFLAQSVALFLNILLTRNLTTGKRARQL